MKLSIIIPVYNALEDLKLCINSLLQSVNFSITEIIAIDDCSNKETKAYLEDLSRQHADKIKVLTNTENLGFIKTCNKGIENANGDIFVLLNSDTIIPKLFCEKIIDCFKNNNNVGIASPISSHSSRYYLPLPLKMSLEDVNEKLSKIHNPSYPKVPSAEGFCFCIRNKTVSKIGLLDTIYNKGYHEEIDYSYRALKNNIDCALIDNLYVYHKNNASFGSAKRKTYIENNTKIFEERWKDFRKNWERKNKHINPIKSIRKEFYGNKFFAFVKCENCTIIKLFSFTFKIK